MNFQDKIVIKFDRIHQYLQELEEMMPGQEQAYSQNLSIKRGCEKTIELAIFTKIKKVNISSTCVA